MQARELEELAQIYVDRGLPYDLARQVGRALGCGACRWRAPAWTQDARWGGPAGGVPRAAAAAHAGCCLVHPTRCCLRHPIALQVAVVLTEKDVIRAHARDELGIGERATSLGCESKLGAAWRRAQGWAEGLAACRR